MIISRHAVVVVGTDAAVLYFVHKRVYTRVPLSDQM